MTALTEYIDKITGGDAFLAGILNTFIADHTIRFGSVITEDELLQRLKQNLVGINLVEGELSFSYSGFNEKIITAGCVNDNLQDPEYLSRFMQGIRRELVKAIYTVPKAASHYHLLFIVYRELQVLQRDFLIKEGHRNK